MLYLELLDFPYQDFQHADLPLVPDDKLLEYGHRITQGYPLSDDVISFAIVKVLYNLEPMTQMLHGWMAN